MCSSLGQVNLLPGFSKNLEMEILVVSLNCLDELGLNNFSQITTICGL